MQTYNAQTDLQHSQCCILCVTVRDVYPGIPTREETGKRF